MVVLAGYVLASLRSGEGERFAVNMLESHRRKVMGPLTHLILVFSGLQRNAMGSNEGRRERLTSLKALDLIFGRSFNFGLTRQPPLRVRV